MNKKLTKILTWTSLYSVLLFFIGSMWVVGAYLPKGELSWFIVGYAIILGIMITVAFLEPLKQLSNIQWRKNILTRND